MTNLTPSDIEQLINGYLSVYLNPRTTNEIFGNQTVFFQKYANDFKNRRFNDEVEINWYLSFDVFGCFRLNEVIELFFKELNTIFKNRSDDIDEIIVSLLIAFYFPYQGFCCPSNFIHQKAFAFFQLSFNNKNSIDNDKMRSYYIRSLFYNAHFCDNAHLFKLQDGVLYFKNSSIKDELVQILDNNLSPPANIVIKYALLMVEFMEKGVKNPIKLDDECYFLSPYTYFLSKDKKPYHHKKTIKHLNLLYCLPKTTMGNFINKQFLLNLMLTNRQTKWHIQKYIQDSIILENILNDINDLHRFYILRKKARQL